MKQFVTGGAGFIGSNYVRWVLANTDDQVTVYDALPTRQPVDPARRRRRPPLQLRQGQHLRPGHARGGHGGPRRGRPLRAESHVDRSIAQGLTTSSTPTASAPTWSWTRPAGWRSLRHPHRHRRGTARSRRAPRPETDRSNPWSPTRPRRPAPTSSPCRTSRPTGCPSASPGAPTTSGPSSSPRRSSPCSRRT